MIMPQRLFIDNWTSFLEAPASTEALTLTVGTEAAARLTGLVDGNYYPLTLSRIETVEGQLRETAWEVVHVTASASGVLDVLRAQEGTTALEWLEGDMASVRLTAAALSDIYARLAAVEAAIPAPPLVTEFSLSVGVKASIYSSFGFDGGTDYPGSTCTPSVLAFGGEIGDVAVNAVFVQPSGGAEPYSLYLKLAHEFTAAQLASIAAQGADTFTGAGAAFFEAASGESTWEWDLASHDWADGVTRTIDLTFDL
uniref:Putative tail protein n=2 Tax=viral metagenome TaxID=1070528 RepID=A0A6M3KGM4_9ZZZZ